MKNQLNCALVGSCWNVYRIYAYEHDKECKKIAIWNEEWESYGMMNRRIVSNFLLCCETLDDCGIDDSIELRVVLLSL